MEETNALIILALLTVLLLIAILIMLVMTYNVLKNIQNQNDIR